MNTGQVNTAASSFGMPEIEGVAWDDTIQKWRATYVHDGRCVLNQSFALVNDAIRARHEAVANGKLKIENGK